MLKANLFFLYTITVVAISSFVLCIFNYDPYTATAYNFIYLYLALSTALVGIIGITIFYLKIYINKSAVVYSLFWPSIRQGAFLSLAITSILILRGSKILDYWTGIPLLIVVLLLELFFQTKKRKE